MVQLQDIAFKHINTADPKLVATVCGSFRRGAASSGDIDILMGHPDYVSTSSVKSPKKKPDFVKRVAEVMEKEGFVTDTLSLGETKFMVRTHVKLIHVGGVHIKLMCLWLHNV